jgi:hypothetical protein
MTTRRIARHLLVLPLLLLAAACQGEPVSAISARLLAPRSLADQAQSVVISVLDGIRVDGSPLGCSSLVGAERQDVYSPELVLLAEAEVDVDAGADDVTIDGVPIGVDRVFLVEVFDQPGGLHRVIARGCTDGVAVDEDAPAEVSVTLDAVE